MSTVKPGKLYWVVARGCSFVAALDKFAAAAYPNGITTTVRGNLLGFRTVQSGARQTKRRGA